MNEAKVIRAQDLHAELSESSVPTLVVFGEIGCRFCAKMKADMDSVARKYNGRLHVFHVADTATSLVEQFQLRRSPTTAYYRVGDYRPFEMEEGSLSVTDLIKLVDNNLPTSVL